MPWALPPPIIVGVATRPSSARQSLHSSLPFPANLLRLPPSAPSDEQLLAVLDRMGYRGRLLAEIEDHWTFIDTPDGALFQQGLSLVDSKRRGRRYLATPHRNAHPPSGGREAIGLKGMLAHLQPTAPQLYCELREKRYRLGNSTGRAMRLSLLALGLRDPYDRVPEAGLRLLALDHEEAVPAVDREYFALLLAERFGCEALGTSMLEEALLTLQLPLPGAPLPNEWRVTRDDTLATACRKLIAGQRYKLEANLPGALHDLDPEFLHALRVAIRRLRHALRLFSPLLDPERLRPHREALAAAAIRSGELRDTDLFLSRLAAQRRRLPASRQLYDRILDSFAPRRAAMLARLREELDSQRFAELRDSRAWPEGGAEPASRAWLPDSPIEPFARARIRASLRRLHGWLDGPTDQLSDEDLHRIRILCRRLRYTLEFFRGLASPRSIRLIERCTEIQDCLGAYRDAAIARDLLAALSGEPSFAAPPFGRQIGALIALQEEGRAAERARFSRLWSDFGAHLRRSER